MDCIFKINLNELQPSQLFISEAKLAQVLSDFGCSKMEPVPVKKIGERIILTDGHTRALAAFLMGLTDIDVYWDEDELDWEAYEICLQWCEDDGIHTIADLAERVVSVEDYESLWLKRCREMQEKLKEKTMSILDQLSSQVGDRTEKSNRSVIVRDHAVDAVSNYAKTSKKAAQAAHPILLEALTLWDGKQAGHALNGLANVALAAPSLADELRAVGIRFQNDKRGVVRKAAKLLINASEKS